MVYRREVGRPLKFQSVEELQTKIDAYFADCDPHLVEVDAVENGKAVKVTKMSDQQPYTMAGLALWLNVNRETIINYSDKPEFSDTIKHARLKVEQYAEKYLYSGKPTTGAQFSLKNNFGYVDKVEVNVNHSLSLRETIKQLELEEITPTIIEGEIIEALPNHEDDIEEKA